jgi:uncharacterized protein YneR
LAKYIHDEIDTSVATNVKLYIKTDGVSTGIVNSSNANMLINFTVADAAAQSALVAALNDNTFGEYILVDNTSPIATMEETAALISAAIALYLKISAPAPPVRISAPAPPVIVSVPASPVIVSAPVPPIKLFASALPGRVLPAITVMLFIDIITTATNGAITDVASLAKYIHAEIDTSVATNVKLYIKTDGVSTGLLLNLRLRGL